jgi:hypothetical protein
MLVRDKWQESECHHRANQEVYVVVAGIICVNTPGSDGSFGRLGCTPTCPCPERST